MDPTTLVTFIFKTPSHIRSVELFGSWDNFSKGYPMRHDTRRGRGTWSGCFSFDNIVCDGDEKSLSRPRSGGLKQGGTYWIYYKLDDQNEAYDDSQPFTTRCPLLPGQTVNVLDVPTEMVLPPSRCRSASANLAGLMVLSASTSSLDPNLRYAELEPPPFSKVHERCKSDLALSGRLENPPARGEPLPEWSGFSAGVVTNRASSRGSQASYRDWLASSDGQECPSLRQGWRQRLRRIPRLSLARPSLPPPPPQPFQNRRAVTQRSTALPHDFDFDFEQSEHELQSTSLPKDHWTPQHIGTYQPTYYRPYSGQDFSSGIPQRYSPVTSQSRDFCSPDQSPEQNAVDLNDEVWSPTSSLAPANSFSEGLETPFRLPSSHQIYDASRSPSLHSRAAGDAVHEATNRLRHLDLVGQEQEEPVSAHPQASAIAPRAHQPTTHRRPIPRAGASYYSLPATDEDASDITPPPLPQLNIKTSNPSLGEVSSRMSRKSSVVSQPLGRELNLPLPSFLQLDGGARTEDKSEGGSLADAIFSELTFLGRSIL